MNMLALPAGGRTRPKNVMNVGVLLLCTGGLMLFGGLIASYAHIAHLNKPWPPQGVTVDNYVGTMLSVTALMSAVTMEWAVWSLKRDDRRQAIGGLGVSLGLALAFLNLLWYLGRTAGFGPGASPYAVVFFALIVAAGAVALIGVVGMLIVLGRTIGRQMVPARHEPVRAVAWYWDFVVVSWIAVYATVWLFTNH
jgi:heme/copper-type cytochrome/quinol oxidase subunit 3